MTASFVFGYGSLVNSATHDFVETHAVKLVGWRRVWRHAAGREVAFLTAVRSEGSEIDGVAARVPDEAWPDLNERERWYLCEQTEEVRHAAAGKTYVYHAPDDLHPPADAPLPILLSYLDVVVQGYLRAFGKPGVEAFFNSTDDWGPVLDDRDAPRYGRHQLLTVQERALADDWLDRIGATRV